MEVGTSPYSAQATTYCFSKKYLDTWIGEAMILNLLRNGFAANDTNYPANPCNAGMAKIGAIRWDFDTNNVALEYGYCGDQVMGMLTSTSGVVQDRGWHALQTIITKFITS